MAMSSHESIIILFFSNCYYNMSNWYSENWFPANPLECTRLSIIKAYGLHGLDATYPNND